MLPLYKICGESSNEELGGSWIDLRCRVSSSLSQSSSQKDGKKARFFRARFYSRKTRSEVIEMYLTPRMLLGSHSGT